MTGMVTTFGFRGHPGCCPFRRGVQAVWATTVPSVGDCGAHRDSGQRRGSDAASGGGLSAERLAERRTRVAPLGEESAASGSSRGGLGSPHGLAARWRHGIESDPEPNRGQVGGLSAVLCFVRSRSPRIKIASSCCIRRSKVAVAERLSQQGATGPHRGCRCAESPVPNRGDKGLETKNELRHGELSPTEEGQCK